MKTKYHVEITQNVLQEYFSQENLKKIIKANIQQDRVKNQFGHDYIHFDGSAFSEGFTYIEDQKAILLKSVEDSDFQTAWAALGRILHSWQDFYSHSNYVQLWHQTTENPSPEEIDHNDPEIFNSPKLISGKNYGIIEFFAMVPGLSRLIKPLMPADSHAKMNLDSPKSGPYFEFAFIAAQKRTKQEINVILHQLFTLDIKREAIHVYLGK
ncbi:MAG: hypothetical protein XD73_1117 [Anaerolinea thermophila]|uniref:VWA7 N-terminal domain-containing protein n=1 Tax=Anaerolinea thermophila TaxID=167964 RepID=A0A101FX07_9CHLR|nr:MAG: hypothetical protein XD73_1117 [Anaerolinea thermophila]